MTQEQVQQLEEQIQTLIKSWSEQVFESAEWKALRTQIEDSMAKLVSGAIISVLKNFTNG